MIRYYPAIYFGTLSASAVRIVGKVPAHENGIIVRGLSLWTSVEIGPHPNDYWVIDLGTVAGQMEFLPRTQTSSPRKGLAAGENPVVFGKFVSYDSGETMALRAYPVGDPASLTEFQVVVGIEEP